MSSATELGELLNAAARAFSQQGRARFGEHGLSPARVRLLTTLGERTDVRMRDLADLLGVTGRAVTATVDSLESEGLVARKPDPSDRRAFQLVLTKEGLAALDRIKQLQQQVSEEIFRGLSAAERDQLAALLRTFLSGRTC
ncbi:MarR family transcriptional regulator [Kibdelosporangium philippinense]|uniref:MarR family transcriptional regulator n=1 Tax=Kibdelosporangium philippinense TaxID=211113 RepID=A0ABS8Z4E2_9PSEU|nr:MarR family transcriptional regulator [Kibdelosporangium philippinense]MCE7002791.1 MarR family transcriptional regulator [Kibdelosporangium philippinense]